MTTFFNRRLPSTVPARSSPTCPRCSVSCPRNPSSSSHSTTAGWDALCASIFRTTCIDTVEHLAEVAAAGWPRIAAIAVIVDEDGATCRMCNDELPPARRCTRRRAVRPRHRASRRPRRGPDRRRGPLALCGRLWPRRHGRGSVGVSDGHGRRPGRPSPLHAAGGTAGGDRRGRPRPHRLLAADHHRLSPIRPMQSTVPTPRPAPTSSTPWPSQRAQPMGGGPSDDDLARLTCALTDPRVRDTLYALSVGRDAAGAESLWVLLARTLPEPWRAEALVLLAFSAYARGDGPLTGVSLEAALRCNPGHRMAGMLDQALQSGMRPEQIRELALHRLPDGQAARGGATAAPDVRQAGGLDLLDLYCVCHVVRQPHLLAAGMACSLPSARHYIVRLYAIEMVQIILGTRSPPRVLFTRTRPALPLPK